MNNWTKADTLVALAAINTAYKAKLDKDQLDTYVNILSDIQPDILMVAVRSAIRSNKFLPTIAEIRSAAQDIYRMVLSEPENDWYIAWNELVRAIARVGYSGKPNWENPILPEVVKHLGWYNLCTMPSDDQSIVRAQFRQIYTDIQGRHKKKMEYVSAVMQLKNESQRGAYKELGCKFEVLAEKMTIKGGLPCEQRLQSKKKPTNETG
ncbi:hypothetical protein [Megasphaera massiliensis]|uniref:hypothetical protein n=1 Tax=Megasphaera massiliensis TaxID=1232428 RepID=UPI00206594D5|nr:hypothetical protein [uncultured Megasphaera sp.]DAL49093.1 MAG TPA_asm: replication protein P [Caudoviricetes sp.]